MKGACDVCGNEYDGLMTIEIKGRQGKFDCFECAIHALAPKCAQCGIKILGHGLQEEDLFFCCASCARMAGESHFVDRLSEIKM